MVRAHIDAYGLVTESDIAWWAGLTMTAVRAALALLAPELARVAGSGLAGSSVLLRSQVATVEGSGVVVVGVWHAVERRTPAIRFHLFAPGNEDVVGHIGEQARGIGRFLLDDEVEVQQLARMAPLTSRPIGAYSPFEGAEGVDTIYSPGRGHMDPGAESRPGEP